MMREDRIQIRDSFVDFAVFGEGERNLVIIPGLFVNSVKGNGKIISMMYGKFGKTFKVYDIDRINDMPTNYTVEKMAEDYAYVLKQLKLKDVYLVGISLGGMIAEYLAIKHPDLVKKLCLITTLSRNNAVSNRRFDRWIELVEKDSWSEFNKDSFESIYTKNFLTRHAQVIDSLLSTLIPENKIRFLTLTKACKTCDCYEKLSLIKCPIFAIGGRRDNVTGFVGIEEIINKTNCENLIYEDYGHGCFEECSDYIDKVIKFFDK